MPISYIGLDSGAQVTRGFWRVTLGAGFDFSDLFSGPLSDLTPWATKVEQWRASLHSIVPVITSPAAVSGTGIATMQARAVVDVQILGAEQGQSVSQVATAMDRLTPRVDVLSIEKIGGLTDSEARSKRLQDAATQAQKESWGDWVKRFLEKSALVLGVGLIALLAVYIFVLRRRA